VQGETYDEPDHIAYARRLVETGETERLSVLHFNSKTPGTVPNAVARQAAKKWLGVRDPVRLRLFSRLPTVAELALLLGTVFVVGRRFLGETAACLATTACALDPNLIANSSLATVDTVYALATLLTLGAVLWMVECPSIGRAIAVGTALGLAFVAKFSAFLLVPAVLVFPWLIPGMRARLRTWTLVPGAFAAAAAMLLVIGAAYRFHDMGAEVNDLGWRSSQMLRIHSLVPHLRLPVPADFMTGFDVLAVAVDKDYPVVLLGRHHPRGVWYYFLAVWLLKEPVLLLAAQVFGSFRTAATGALWRHPALAYLALNLALNLAYFSFFFATQVGFRFVLMCLPLVALIAAAGLAPFAATARGRRWVVVAAVAALAESVPYLGNHLAFTNAAVWPKREAFRLLNNSNLDWGQNDEKIHGWLEQQGLAAAVNPIHAVPGDNVFGLNILAGVGKFRQHLWLREHVTPVAHLGHTYLWFHVDPVTYERMLEEDRHLRPGSVDRRLCAGATAAGSIADGAPLVLPDLGRTEGRVLCFTAGSRLDVGLIAEQGSVVLGPGGQRLRDQALLREGEQTWYRLEPGTSALAVFATSGFRGRWALKGGPAALATRAVTVERGAIAEKDGGAPPPVSPR
jgi:dolichyl-phosphate-mannose-protein mannosyltransferase